LDWEGGNRSVLVDGRLSGAIVGLTLATTAPEIYRALLESTAFGTRMIMDTFSASGVPVTELVVAGGLSKTKPLMQIHADVTPRAGLSTLTWGNVGGIDRDAGVYVIKPSGVSYDDLTAEQLVVVDLEDGRVVDGHLRPSVDSETHRRLYLAFGGVGGITHTHSPSAVAFAQAKRDIPVLGTTHADAFNGPIRCTRDLTTAECAADSDYNTGQAIVDVVDVP